MNDDDYELSTEDLSDVLEYLKAILEDVNEYCTDIIIEIEIDSTESENECGLDFDIL